MPDFSKRASGEEIMDDLCISGKDLHRALRELEVINNLLGGNTVTIDGVRHLLRGVDTTKVLKIVDLGCGSGDQLKLIRKWLNRKKLQAILTGIDANANVIQYARGHTSESCGIHYEALNIFSDEFKDRKFDIVTGTLFFHHFTTDQLIGFLRQLKDQASVGLIINDIHRHWISYYSIKWLTALFSRSRMVKHDAAQSVLRAFSKAELREIFSKAGLPAPRIQWRWAFRWQAIVRF